MFASSNKGAGAYAKIGLETGVAAATPHRLIGMLFEGALTAIAAAVSHMQAGEIAQKGMAVSKAIMIIEHGLRASLNKAAGGEIASSLDSLYEYMGRCLMQGNLKNDLSKLNEVRDLLLELKGAWDGIAEKTNPQETNTAPVPQQYDSLAPRQRSLVAAG